MIVNFLFQLLISFITFGINFLPNYNGLSQTMLDSFYFIQPYINAAYAVFPVGTLLLILSLMVSIEIAVFSWDAFWWIYDKMPGKFT